MTPPVIAVAWPKDDYLSALKKAGAALWLVQPDTDAASRRRTAMRWHPAHGRRRRGARALRGARTTRDVETAIAVRDQLRARARTPGARDGVPLLAICRGIQLLNVAARRHARSGHSQPAARHAPHRLDQSPAEMAHDVAVAAGTGSRTSRAGHGSAGPHPREQPPSPGREGAGAGICVSRPWRQTASSRRSRSRRARSASACNGIPENYWRTGEFDALFNGLVAAAATARRIEPAATVAASSALSSATPDHVSASCDRTPQRTRCAPCSETDRIPRSDCSV